MLDYKQIKIIKKNIHTLPLADVARKADLTEQLVLNYLKEKWTADKFSTYIKSRDIRLDNKEMEKKYDIISNIENFNFRSWLRENVWALLFLTIIVVVVYFNAMNYTFVSDDVDGILRNKQLGNLDYVFKYKLGVLFTLRLHLIQQFFGNNPFWFRFPSVITHILTAYVIYFIFSLFKNKKLALFGASIFAVHPIFIEAVTWISGGVYSNYTLLTLSSFVCYLFVQRNKWFYLPSLIFFLLGIFTSVNAVLLIPILWLYEFSFSNDKKTYLKTLPYVFILGMFGAVLVLPAFFERSQALQTVFYQEKGWDNPFIVSSIALTYYIRLILWPDALTLYHSLFDMTPLYHFIRAVSLLTYFGLIYFFYKKNRTIFFWLVFYIFSLLLVITPFRISWMVAERYVYMGSIGIIFGIAYLFDWLTEDERFKNIAYLLFVAIFIALSVRTIIRNNDWKDPDTLYLSMENISYNDPKTHNNLGDVYGRRGEFEKSAYEFKKAIELKPNYGDAYFNLGNTYLQWGKDKWASAEANYKMALSFNPNIWQGYAQLAYIYYSVGKFDLAYENIQKAISINKESIYAYNLAAMISAALNDTNSAGQFLQMATKLDPKDKMTLDNIDILKKQIDGVKK
jgi:hypothetical protein